MLKVGATILPVSNKLAASYELCSKIVRQAWPTGSTVFRDPQALGSALAALGSLQPRAFWSLNTVDPSVLLSNYYLDTETEGSTVFRNLKALGCSNPSAARALLRA